MSNQHESLHEKTLNNENLAGPQVNYNGVGGNHSNLHDRTANNQNLTPPSPGAPLERDFSRNSEFTLFPSSIPVPTDIVM